MAGSESYGWDDPSDEELLAMSDAEFEAMTFDVAALLQEGPVDIEREQPPAWLWSAIAADAGITIDAGTSTDVAVTTETVDPVPGASVPDRGRTRADASPLERSSADTSSGNVTPFRSRSRWSGRTAALTLVAAAVLLVLVPLGLSVVSSDDDADVVAQAELEVLDPAAAGGHADLIAADDGGVLLSLDVEAQAPEDEYLELWLLAIDDDGVETLSLGRFDGEGPYEIPADVDRSRFNVVDISIEADDGDASHSGRSILRGELTT